MERSHAHFPHMYALKSTCPWSLIFIPYVKNLWVDFTVYRIILSKSNILSSKNSSLFCLQCMFIIEPFRCVEPLDFIVNGFSCCTIDLVQRKAHCLTNCQIKLGSWIEKYAELCLNWEKFDLLECVIIRGWPVIVIDFSQVAGAFSGCLSVSLG